MTDFIKIEAQIKRKKQVFRHQEFYESELGKLFLAKENKHCVYSGQPQRELPHDRQFVHQRLIGRSFAKKT